MIIALCRVVRSRQGGRGQLVRAHQCQNQWRALAQCQNQCQNICLNLEENQCQNQCEIQCENECKIECENLCQNQSENQCENQCHNQRQSQKLTVTELGTSDSNLTETLTISVSGNVRKMHPCSYCQNHTSLLESVTNYCHICPCHTYLPSHLPIIMHAYSC